MNLPPSSRRSSEAPGIGGLTLPSSQSSKNKRTLRLWLIWTFLSAFCGFLDWSQVQGAGFSTFDSYFYKILLGMSARRNLDLIDKARKQIVIVPITDNTFDPTNPDYLSGPPVSRSAHARVLSDLKKAGARAVVFDIVFKGPGQGTKHNNDDLVNAAKQPGAPAVWACLRENEDLKPRLTKPFDRLIAASPRLGDILSPQVGDTGSITRIDTVSVSSDIPALSVAAVLAGKEKNAALSKTATGWRSGSLNLPNSFYIQYLQNDDGTDSFAMMPFEQVAHGAAFDEFAAKNHFFKDKIVIIGDETKIFNDFRSTPIGVLPGVEIQANAIASVLMAESGAHPLGWDVPSWAAFAVLTAMCGLTVLVASRFSPLRGAIGLMSLAVGYLVVETVAFIDHGLILHTTGPMVAITLAALLVFLERGAWEENEKLYVRGLLGRYVSPSVADYILRHPERCALGGEEVNATVLFADIRGFTALTERFPPRVTLGLLNDYFQAMSDVVFANNGMVDKFMGDAIMAIFGAPVANENHAADALNAAIQMLERIDELQARWKRDDLPEIRIGIGIGTGTMIIGNMGSEMRADFSVIGDAVNMAARLQDLNKELGTTVLISSATREACAHAKLPAWVHIEEAEHVQIRGHAKQDEVFPVSVDSIREIPTEIVKKRATF